jgi:hypothetical protein
MATVLLQVAAVKNKSLYIVYQPHNHANRPRTPCGPITAGALGDSPLAYDRKANRLQRGTSPEPPEDEPLLTINTAENGPSFRATRLDLN